MPDHEPSEPDADTPDAEPGPEGSRTEAETSPLPPRERLRKALARPGRQQIVVAVLLGLVGFAAVTQVRINENDDDYSGLRQQELINVLEALSGARQRSQADIAELEKVRDELRSDTSKRRAALEQAENDVDDLNILAGLVPVTGPGIRATITEVDGRVHQDSMIDVIQELRTNEAEAIQINGSVRVVATTSIQEVTGGFLIDQKMIEAPYVIEAIGDSAALAGALDTRVGAGAGVEEDGAEVTSVDEEASIDITAVVTQKQPKYADPDDGE